MAILSGDGLDSGGTTYEAQEEDTTTSTSSTSDWESSIDNKAAAIIDVQTSGSGNVDEQLQGGTTASDIIGDVQANADVTQELATQTAIGDATNAVPGSVQDTVNEAQNQVDRAMTGALDWGPIVKVVGAFLALLVGLTVLGD